jgi:Leucine-rich repeat (LRR) protein
VNCSNAALHSIPLSLPTHARELVLDGNNMTFLENNSFVSKGPVELLSLNADSCNIRESVLGSFNGLTELLDLSMSDNEISEITPGTFDKVSRLLYIYLDNNIIEHLKSDIFYGLVNLMYTNLDGNKLQYLHPDTFIRSPNLYTVYLEGNPDLQIPTDSHFINSHILKQLDISQCNVSSVSVETFAIASALKWLDLSYNYVRNLDISILKSLPSLSTLYLFGNPLQCDCQL